MKTKNNTFGTPFGDVYNTPFAGADTTPTPQIVPQQDPKKQNLTQGRSKENETFPYIKKDR